MMMNDIRKTLNALSKLDTGDHIDQYISSLNEDDLSDYVSILSEDEIDYLNSRYRNLDEGPKDWIKKAGQAWKDAQDKQGIKAARKRATGQKEQNIKDFNSKWIEYWETRANKGDPNAALAKFVKREYGLSDDQIKTIKDNGSPTATFKSNGEIENLEEILPFILDVSEDDTTDNKSSNSKSSDVDAKDNNLFTDKRKRAAAQNNNAQNSSVKKGTGGSNAVNDTIIAAIKRDFPEAKLYDYIQKAKNKATFTNEEGKLLRRIGYYWLQTLKVK